MDELRAFTNGVDTYIAKSVDDVLAAYKEFTGEEYVPEYGEPEDWKECDPEKYHKVCFDDEQKEFPEGFEIAERDDYSVTARAKYKHWAAWHDRGFLSSTEF